MRVAVGMDQFESEEDREVHRSLHTEFVVVGEVGTANEIFQDLDRSRILETGSDNSFGPVEAKSIGLDTDCMVADNLVEGNDHKTIVDGLDSVDDYIHMVCFDHILDCMTDCHILGADQMVAATFVVAGSFGRPARRSPHTHRAGRCSSLG